METNNSEISISSELIQLLTPEQAWHYQIIPAAHFHDKITFYADQQQLKNGLNDELELLLNCKIEIKHCAQVEISKALSKYYRIAEKEQYFIRNAKTLTNDSDDFLMKLIFESKSLGSSDIHIESYEDRCRIRIRIDGRLIEKYIVSSEDYPELINRIKIKARLDIAERRLPQDGRIVVQNDHHHFDIRVSVLPTHYGEKIVLRLLNRNATDVDIRLLGLSNSQLNAYTECLKKTQGMILISGPTGSGKTTTLYATLKLLNKVSNNILTIEDPVEYTLSGINQVQLKENIGLTFAKALRTFLRQDPDIIMLGEIRDQETAVMAIRAALTGHLVLSTIHTNSAWGVVSRLCDMQIPSYLLANTLNLVAAQRLVRLLCPHCKQKLAFNKVLIPEKFSNHVFPEHIYQASGCDYCHYTGYKGRSALFEIIPIDADFITEIKNMNHDVSELLSKRQIQSLAESAIQLLIEGATSADEIYPVLLNY